MVLCFLREAVADGYTLRVEHWHSSYKLSETRDPDKAWRRMRRWDGAEVFISKPGARSEGCEIRPRSPWDDGKPTVECFRKRGYIARFCARFEFEEEHVVMIEIHDGTPVVTHMPEEIKAVVWANPPKKPTA